MTKSIHTPGWLKHLEPKHDFFALLEQHARLVHQAFLGLTEWFANSAQGECKAMHECEHRADEIKRQIEKSLNDTFVTPFDREEIYDLTERIDLVLTKAKLMVKDIEFFSANESDQYLIEMSKVLANGTDNLANTVEKLKTDVHAAEKHANETRKTHTALAKLFRPAMKEAYELKDPIKLIRKKQLYDDMTDIAFRVSKVGEKLAHLSIKMS